VKIKPLGENQAIGSVSNHWFRIKPLVPYQTTGSVSNHWLAIKPKINSLLPANSDGKNLPLDQAQSEFVGRRVGDEGQNSCRETLIDSSQSCKELNRNLPMPIKQPILLLPPTPLLVNSVNA
jgi:hypothetical protein